MGLHDEMVRGQVFASLTMFGTYMGISDVITIWHVPGRASFD